LRRQKLHREQPVTNSKQLLLTDATKGLTTTMIITMECLTDTGRRITHSTDDHRDSALFFQRLLVLIQRYNAVLGTFAHKELAALLSG